MKKSLFLISLLTFSFFSCKKSKDDHGNGACQLSSANIVGSYKVTSLKYKISSSGPESDVYGTLLQPCQQDDIYKLNADGTLNYTDAGTSCTPSGTATGTWSLTGVTLTINGQMFTVSNYNCTTITGTKSNVNTPGDMLTSTFTRQ